MVACFTCEWGSLSDLHFDIDMSPKQTDRCVVCSGLRKETLILVGGCMRAANIFAVLYTRETLFVLRLKGDECLFLGQAMSTASSTVGLWGMPNKENDKSSNPVSCKRAAIAPSPRAGASSPMEASPPRPSTLQSPLFGSTKLTTTKRVRWAISRRSIRRSSLQRSSTVFF